MSHDSETKLIKQIEALIKNQMDNSIGDYASKKYAEWSGLMGEINTKLAGLTTYKEVNDLKVETLDGKVVKIEETLSRLNWMIIAGVLLGVLNLVVK